MEFVQSGDLTDASRMSLRKVGASILKQIVQLRGEEMLLRFSRRCMLLSIIPQRQLVEVVKEEHH